MTSRTASKRAKTAGGNPAGGKPTARRRPRGRRGPMRASPWPKVAIAVVVVVALAGLYLVYRSATHTAAGGTGTSAGGGSGYPYAVGQPGVGVKPPEFALASTAGGQLDLASLGGRNVLLYFQEGLSCQPCWDQLTDLEKHAADLKAAGIDTVVSITSDPVDLLTQKVHDMGLSTPVLSDPDLAVSKSYRANEYGMMGTSRDGHTFILVRHGTIAWRADYGGAPKYTMFVPTTAILTDLRNATAGAGASTGTTP